MSIKDKTLDYSCSVDLFNEIKEGKTCHCYRRQVLWKRKLEGEAAKRYVFVGFRCANDKEKRLKAKIKSVSIVEGTEIGLRTQSKFYDIEFELKKKGKKDE